MGQVLDKKIPPSRTNPNHFNKKNYNINIFLSPATDYEIGKIIDNLQECATGWDSIPANILKENKNTIISILTHVINNSLSSGIFPRELKIANVIPLFKNGSIEEITNFRPVSLSSTFLKIYEKIFYKRLINFLKAQNFFI